MGDVVALPHRVRAGKVDLLFEPGQLTVDWNLSRVRPWAIPRSSFVEATWWSRVGTPFTSVGDASAVPFDQLCFGSWFRANHATSLVFAGPLPVPDGSRIVRSGRGVLESQAGSGTFRALARLARPRSLATGLSFLSIEDPIMVKRVLEAWGFTFPAFV